MAYSKYNAKKVCVDGHTFDSKKEAGRYVTLKMLMLAGEITQLELQPRFELLPAKRLRNGKTQRKMEYVADFRYVDMATGKTIVEDVKGFKTKEYAVKKKLFLFRYDDLVEFREI